MGRVMAQAVRRRPLTAEAQVRSQVSPCDIGGGRSGTRTGFSFSTLCFPCQYHCTNAASHLHLHVALTRWTKPGELSERNALSKLGKHWIEKNFHLVFKGFILHKDINKAWNPPPKKKLTTGV